MVSVNYRDSRPIYEQIADSLRMQIVKGIILPDEKLPSVRELASELAINPNTIQRAIRQLEQEGFVYTVSGRGTFAASHNRLESPRRKELLEQLDGIIDELLLYETSLEDLVQHIERRMERGDKA